MTCSGCSGAVERVLKKREGKDTYYINSLNIVTGSFNQGHNLHFNWSVHILFSVQLISFEILQVSRKRI